MTIRSDRPLISFTFDDFPRSALMIGGSILSARGFRGTYYVALGLLGTDSPSGKIIDADDLRVTLDQGHELGCHTYSHNDSWDTDPGTFEESIMLNRNELQKLVPGAHFRSFSYPRSSPRPTIKRAAARHFLSCRGGAQRSNIGTADLNQLSAYFLEKCNGDIGSVRQLIDMNRDARGWLILATHDVTRQHGPYGCTPDFFEEVVEYSAKSGARILPVVEVVEALRGS